MPSPEEKENRGRPIIGDQPRKRYNVTLDPAIQEKAVKAAKCDGESFSMWVEIALKEKLRQ